MNKRKAYKFRIYPTGEQEIILREFARSSRFIYNTMLRQQMDRYEAKKGRIANGDTSKRDEDKHLSHFDMVYLITSLRKDDGLTFLTEAPYDALSAAAKAVDKAYKSFFKGVGGHPRFHNSRYKLSYTQKCVTAKVDFEKRKIQIPKVGWVKCRGYDSISGKPKNISVSFDSGQWFCSIQTEEEVPEPSHPSNLCVGIDRGVVKTATLSNGTSGVPPEFEAKYEARRKNLEQRIQALQRRAKRKQAPDRRKGQKPSNRWRAAQDEIRSLQLKLKNMRLNYLHNLSCAVTDKYVAVAIEDLNVQGMTGSARGTKESPGKNVRAKSGLNREILARGWGELERQLVYKATFKGGKVVKVDPRNTSRRCSKCGHTSKDNRKTQALFECQSCGFKDNADVNAAINIRNAAFKVKKVVPVSPLAHCAVNQRKAA